MTKTRLELIEVVAERTALPVVRAEELVKVVFDSMVAALKRGEGVELRGFGTFTIREYGAYKGRNPRSGDPVLVPAKRSPHFRAGRELRKRVNGVPA